MKGKNYKTYFRNLSLVEITFIPFLTIYKAPYYFKRNHILLINPHKTVTR